MNTLNLLVIGISTTGAATGAGLLAQHGEIALPRVAVFAQTISGVVASVDLENGSFTLTTEDGSTETITVTSETAYALDGEKATAEEVLEMGAAVEATVNELYEASSVSRTTDG